MLPSNANSTRARRLSKEADGKTRQPFHTKCDRIIFDASVLAQYSDLVVLV